MMKKYGRLYFIPYSYTDKYKQWGPGPQIFLVFLSPCPDKINVKNLSSYDLRTWVQDGGLPIARIWSGETIGNNFVPRFNH